MSGSVGGTSGGTAGHGEHWSGHGAPQNSEKAGSPFPQAIRPEVDPFKVIPAPPNISNEIWQTSYYDATSSADMGVWKQRPAGPCDLKTGRVIDGDWPESHLWSQV